jgi:hypothetical protein
LHILPYLQKNAQSLGYHQGRLSPYREMGTHLFQQLIMQYLRNEQPVLTNPILDMNNDYNYKQQRQQQ